MKKTLSFLIAVIILAAALHSYAAAGFADVEDGRWSANSIKHAVDNGYMKGVGDGLFDPEGSLTRAMAATVLWRREGSPAPAAPSGFSDVPADEWYADAVAWAKETEVVKGLTETTFGPDELITREQLATMLFRFSSTAPVSVPERADLSPFADDEKVSDWADEPLEWAVESGLIKGTDRGRLAPDGFATREQFAAIIERYDNSFRLEYNEPVLFSHYTEPEYPPVDGADFYVAADGDDTSDGSFSHPFRTWERARDAVRTLDRTGRDGITVAFKAGDYGPLSIELTAGDSGTPECPITYCKYGDGDVVFSNGFTVREHEFTPVSEDEAATFPSSAVSKIRKADVSDRLAEYDPVRCLVLSGKGACALARYPNLFEDGSDHLIEKAGYNADDNHVAVTHTILLKRIEKYRPGERIYLYGYLTTGWSKDYLETDGFDAETGTFSIPHPETAKGGRLRRLPEFDSAAYNQTALVNASEELDFAGEYWIDPETKTLYVYDPVGDYDVAGDRGVMIRADHADFITLRGLEFKNSIGALFEAEHSHGITLSECAFSGCAAENAVSFKECDPGRDFDITVGGCDFRLLCGTALEVEGDGDLAVLWDNSRGVVIDNNLFELISLTYGAKGAINVSTNGALISHNYFRRCSWEAVYYHNAINMTAEYNVFDEVCCNGDDVGVLQNYADIGRCGNLIRHNLFLNINGGTNGRYGVYLDGSSGTEISSNIFYGCDRIVMYNSLNKLSSTHGNAIVNPYKAEPSGAQIHPELSWFNEITDDDAEVAADGTYGRFEGMFRYFDYRPELKARVAGEWPGFFDITADIAHRRDPAFCLNTSVGITENYEISPSGSVLDDYPDYVRKYCVIENNRGFTLSENPLFVNPARGDYRIKEGADFPYFPFEKIGRY